jgi:hypothetical protein
MSTIMLEVDKVEISNLFLTFHQVDATYINIITIYDKDNICGPFCRCQHVNIVQGHPSQ